MNDNKQFWQRVASLYSPFMEKGNGRLYDDICAEISSKLRKNMNVLELACGSGQLTFRLADKVARWEATDFSPNMISEAQKQFVPANLYFDLQDATDLPYADGSFDAVVIANALHIMPEPDKAMAEICRVLKNGGTLYAPTFVHGEGAGYHIRIKLMNLIGFKTYSKWSTEEYEKYIEEHGFQVEVMTVIGSTLTPLCCLIAKKAI